MQCNNDPDLALLVLKDLIMADDEELEFCTGTGFISSRIHIEGRGKYS